MESLDDEATVKAAHPLAQMLQLSAFRYAACVPVNPMLTAGAACMINLTFGRASPEAAWKAAADAVRKRAAREAAG